MPAQIILNQWKRDRTISYSEQIRRMFTLWEGHYLLLPAFVYRKQPTIRQGMRAVFENHLIFSHRFAKNLKQCWAANSKRLSWMPVDEKTPAEKQPITALDRQGTHQQRPESPTVSPTGMQINTRYMNSTKGTSSMKNAPMWLMLVEKDRRHKRGSWFGGQMHAGLGGTLSLRNQIWQS